MQTYSDPSRADDPHALPDVEVFRVHYTKLTARSVSFSDLARAQCVFVKAHGIHTGPSGGCWSVAKATAAQHGFRLEE